MLEVKTRDGITVSTNDIYVDEVLVLNHRQRKKGRLRVTTESGVVVGMFLERGKTLAVGEVLRSCCGKTIRIKGAQETVITASIADHLEFSRACYHLGNRHVTLQVGEGWLRFKPDHVLEDLVQRLGLTVIQENVVFEPEDGAYTRVVSSHHHEH